MKKFIKNIQFKKIFKNSRFKNVFIASIVILVFFLLDWFTKYYLYDDHKQFIDHPTEFSDYKVFGIRSLRHNNTTFFSFLDINIGWKWLVVIDAVLLFSFLTPIFFIKHKIFAISLGILLGGMFGNSLDILMTDGHYVRDIFYIPWFDRGTFNLADLFIVIGSGLTFLGIIFTQVNFKKSNRNKLKS